VNRLKSLISIVMAIIFLTVMPACENSSSNSESSEAGNVKRSPQASGFKDDELDTGVTVEKMAYHWAPIHYQDIYSSEGDESRHDYITRIDRNASGGKLNEGEEWNLENNWDKDLKYKLPAYVYYSVVESDSHYYITYSYFHPWDTQLWPTLSVAPSPWANTKLSLTDIFADSWLGLFLPELGCAKFYDFELPGMDFKLDTKRGSWEKNDMEGVLFVVKKVTGNKYGELEGVFAQAHGFIQTYLTDIGWDRFNPREERVRPFVIAPVYDNTAIESMGENLPDNEKVARIITTQEMGGHGAGCWPDWGAPSPGDALDPLRYHKRHANSTLIEKAVYKEAGNDHIRYIPTMGEPEEPNYSEVQKNGYTYCKYQLINVFDKNGLWDNRNNRNVYKDETDMVGDHGDAPWSWYGSKEGLNPDFIDKQESEGMKKGASIVASTVIKICKSLFVTKVTAKKEVAPKSEFNEPNTDEHAVSNEGNSSGDEEDYNESTNTYEINDDWAARIKNKFIRELLQKILDEIDPVNVAIGKIIEQRDRLKEEIKQMEKQVVEQNFTIDSYKKSITDNKALFEANNKSIEALGNSLSDAQRNYSKLTNEMINTPSKIAHTYKKIIRKKVSNGWKPWKWKEIWETITDMIVNPTYYALSVQRDVIDGQIKILQAQKEGLVKSQKTMLDRIETAEKGIDYANQLINSASFGISLRITTITDLIEDLERKEKQLEKLRNAYNDIQNMKLDNIIKKMLKEPLNTFAEMVVFSGPMFSAYKQELYDRYRPLELSDVDIMKVKTKHRPWTHNPAHLCQVYLPVKNPVQNDYFSNRYILNGYMSDTLNGNFYFDLNTGEAVFK